MRGAPVSPDQSAFNDGFNNLTWQYHRPIPLPRCLLRATSSAASSVASKWPPFVGPSSSSNSSSSIAAFSLEAYSGSGGRGKGPRLSSQGAPATPEGIGQRCTGWSARARPEFTSPPSSNEL
ncbi:uncharacterized protein SCHCODRAFT_02666275 [Schizophyllum commune H4-8]|nr:uncharacterized protein SCHCODRAFT_02666275 [Schizophyllum commune H4-8]KAI5893126.1 hypothetical protein SCHCODRAFT_02666275 [Schizophyllum commune H4-8]